MRANRNRTFGVEGLETRAMMAGNVVATFDTSNPDYETLTITGTGSPSVAVEYINPQDGGSGRDTVRVGSDTTLTLMGHNAGLPLRLSINGFDGGTVTVNSCEAVSLNATGSFRLNLFNSRFDGPVTANVGRFYADSDHFNGNVTAAVGAGSSIEIDGCGLVGNLNATVASSTAGNAPSGASLHGGMVGLFNSTIHGNVSIIDDLYDSGKNGAQILIGGTAFFGGTFAIQTGDAWDLIYITGSGFYGETVSINDGGGKDSLTFGTLGGNELIDTSYIHTN